MAIQDVMARHGAGTHQWNLYYRDVQFYLKVRLVSVNRSKVIAADARYPVRELQRHGL